MPKPAKTKPPKPAAPRPEANGAAAPEVMTLAEAAAWLRVPEDGLRADAESGRVPARLVAGEWRFNRNSLRIWFGESEKSAARSSKERMLTVFGAWKDFGEDPEELIAELKRTRQAMSVQRE